VTYGNGFVVEYDGIEYNEYNYSEEFDPNNLGWRFIHAYYLGE